MPDMWDSMPSKPLQEQFDEDLRKQFSNTSWPAMTATEVQAKIDATEHQLKKIAEALAQPQLQHAANVVCALRRCADCNTVYPVYLYETRDLFNSHCPQCEAAQKDAGGL